MKVLSRTNIFSLAIAIMLIFSGAANAAPKTNKQLYKEAVSQINAAIAAEDDALIASIIAKAAVDNPALVKALTTYAVKKNPKSAPAIVAAVQKAAPKLAKKATDAATSQLSKDPKNATILSQVRTATAAINKNKGSKGSKSGSNTVIVDFKPENPAAVGNVSHSSPS